MLEHIQRRRLAALITEERDVGELLTGCDLLLDDRQLLPGGHRIQIGLGHLRGQCDRNGVTVSTARVRPEATGLQRARLGSPGREVVSHRNPAGPRVEEGRLGNRRVAADRQTAELEAQPAEGGDRSLGIETQRRQEGGTRAKRRSLGLRDPLLLAKQCATIDVLTNGRLLPAFGIGSTFSADWRTTGTPTKRRGKRTDEGLEIISRPWKGEEVTLDGEFFQDDGVRISPLPAQAELPLWIGGSSDAAIRRTVKYGTGWQASFENPEQAGQTVAKIKQGMIDAGRDFEDDHFGTGINYRFGKWDDDVVVRAAKRFERVGGRDSRRSFAIGGAAEVLEKIRAFADAGLPKLILRPLASNDEDTIKQTQLMIDEIQPEIAAMNLADKAANGAAAN